ncbi:MAG: NAD(P)H-hydrate dehydratase [Pseudomonadota bacterium]
MSKSETSHLLTAAQMRALEQAAIDSGAVTGLELMEGAGRGVVEAIFEEWPELAKAPHRAVVLCGPGNNGGDGFVIARLLKEWEWEVEVFLYGDPAKLPPDAKVNYDRWLGIGRAEPLDDAAIKTAVYDGEKDLLIDALFGTGLKRGVDLPLAAFGPRWIETDGAWRPDKPYRMVSVDLPSGLCSDTGQQLGGGGGQFFAQLTVTFHRKKLGHILARGPRACGKTVTVDIGLPADPRADKVSLVGPPVSHRVGKKWGHKYTNGHALILSGPMGRSGAARLAARGALRIGAGLVTVAVPGSAMMECAAQLTAIMLRKCDGVEGLASILEDDRLNAVCLGPGLGVSEETRDLVAVSLGAGGGRHRNTRSVVLDADALTSFADDPAALFDMLHAHAVLTPHSGELARLFPDIAAKLNEPATKGPAYSKVDATREAAARAGCVVLFKGPDTVIADPSGMCSINAAVYNQAAPWLATAGSGDVLAGMIAGLLARGISPMEAAESAAWLHAEAARAFGPGLIAEDIPEMLPKVFRDLGL